MARPLEVDWQDDEKTLYTCYKQATDPQDRTRLQALWLLRQGRTRKEVASIVGAHPTTVGRWVDWYRQGRLGKVLAHRHGGHGGKQSRLAPEQEAQLVEKAEAGELRTIWDGVGWVKETCDVEYTYWGMRHVFGRLNLTKKVPRPKSPQASAEEQEAWKKGG